MKPKRDLWRIFHAWGEDAGGATDAQWKAACEYLDLCWHKPTIKSAMRYAQRVANATGHPIAVQPAYNVGRRCKTYFALPNERAKRF